VATTINVISEITGSVWKIELKEGDAVSVDDTIMVLESMKMEIPVLATRSGRIAQLLVTEGQAIKDNQPLAVIEAA
jgi:acetyl-CoA carboxylase biotin carboxyl carrier protein